MYVERVVVVGAGLTGSVLSEALIATIESSSINPQVVYVDFDKLEKRNCVGNHNVHRDVGENKAALLSKRLNLAGVQSRAIQQRLTDKNYKSVLRTGDLLVGAVDNVEARVIMWHAAKDLGIPYMDIGINRFSFVVSWVWGAVDTMPYSPSMGSGYHKKVKETELPACELIASRIQAVMAAELAAKSISIFVNGSDPSFIVSSLSEGTKNAENGDMVGWHGTSTGFEYSVRGEYLGGEERNE